MQASIETKRRQLYFLMRIIRNDKNTIADFNTIFDWLESIKRTTFVEDEVISRAEEYLTRTVDYFRRKKSEQINKIAQA